MLGMTILGRYVVTKFLQESGTGRMFLATEKGTNRQVVLRLLPAKLCSQLQFQDMFRREMELLGRLKHPNIAGLYDSASSTPYGPCVFTEYVDGESVGALLKKEHRFSPLQVGKWLGQICSALQFAHGLGVFHRSLNSANIRVVNPGAANEVVKIMDFGLAKPTLITHLPLDKFPTLFRSIAALPEYLSPEQLHGGEIDGRSDLYSLGVVLFELLTGQRPHGPGAGSQGVNLANTATRRPQAPAFEKLGVLAVPRGIEDVVQRCLCEYTAERPRDARELVRDYERALAEKITVDDAAVAVTKPPSSTTLSGMYRAPRPGTVVFAMEAWMPESIAVMKLQGFLSGVTSEILENAPGLVRVRLHRPHKPPATPAKSGIFGIRGHAKNLAPPPPSPIEMKLYMERKDPNQPNLLSMVLALSAFEGSLVDDPEGRTFCEQVCRDICAYLMARAVS